MKKLLILFLLLCPIAASAQDVIVKKDGSTIVSKVLEITTTEVKYKRFSNLDGPTYTISKTEIKAINYENGTSETIHDDTPQKPISDYELLQMADGVTQMQKEEVGQPNIIKAKRLKISGWVVGPVLAATGIIMIAVTPDPFSIGLYAPIGFTGVGFIAAGITTTTVCLLQAKKLQENSIYSLRSVPVFQQDFAFDNGTSLSTHIDILKDNRLKSQTLGIGLSYKF